MKIILIAIVFLSACNSNPIDNAIERNRLKKLGYNPFTDSLVNAVIQNENLILFDHSDYGDVEYFTLRYKSIQFDIRHQRAVSYKQTEEYSYSAANEQGEAIYIESFMDSPINKVSEQTLKKILSIAQDKASK